MANLRNGHLALSLSWLWGPALTGTILLGLAGCKTPKGLPEDPLFLSHAPIEVKAQAGPPQQLVSTEPAMPVLPVNLASFK